MPRNTEWMSTMEVAHYFGLSCQRYVADWPIPYLAVVTPKGRVLRRYKRADVLAYEQAHTLKPTSAHPQTLSQ
ncbi:hypothetical protein [Thiolinea disciformis]|uniref:hypothetical protein n=1 Tax=Thiolinea disciformis TaxID=125614 RepID=UPI00037CD3E5|nr:hypothetical protein [Thiolinea disciformis]